MNIGHKYLISDMFLKQIQFLFICVLWASSKSNKSLDTWEPNGRRVDATLNIDG